MGTVNLYFPPPEDNPEDHSMTFAVWPALQHAINRECEMGRSPTEAVAKLFGVSPYMAEAVARRLGYYA